MPTMTIEEIDLLQSCLGVDCKKHLDDTIRLHHISVLKRLYSIICEASDNVGAMELGVEPILQSITDAICELELYEKPENKPRTSRLIRVE